MLLLPYTSSAEQRSHLSSIFKTDPVVNTLKFRTVNESVKKADRGGEESEYGLLLSPGIDPKRGSLQSAIERLRVQNAPGAQ